MTDRSDDAIRAGEAPSATCEHHWVSVHQGDFPDEVYWVDRCSLCDPLWEDDGRMHTVHVSSGCKVGEVKG